MQVGDLVRHKALASSIVYWHVWFFDSQVYIVVYAPLMKKVEKIT